MTKKEEKTHILWNPNKNYLGSWDIPESGELILTIKSIKWEEVTHPQTGNKTQERIIEFVEDKKPMICNQTNSRAIQIAVKIDYLEDITNQKISIYTENGKWFGEFRDALRIRTEQPKEKTKSILKKGTKEWEKVIKKATEDKLDPDYFDEWFEISPELKEEIKQLTQPTS